jgi:hypothetical protein
MSSDGVPMSLVFQNQRRHVVGVNCFDGNILSNVLRRFGELEGALQHEEARDTCHRLKRCEGTRARARKARNGGNVITATLTA